MTTILSVFTLEQSWYTQTGFEFVEGIAAITVLLLLFRMKSRLAKSMPWMVSLLGYSRSHVGLLSANGKRTLMRLCIAGAIAFVLLALFQGAYPVWPMYHFQRQINRVLLDQYGLISFILAGFVILGLAVYNLEIGFSSSLKLALRVFALPSMVLYEATLVFLQIRNMDVGVAHFAGWQIGGVCIMSNWFLLIMAVFLFLNSRKWGTRKVWWDR